MHLKSALLDRGDDDDDVGDDGFGVYDIVIRWWPNGHSAFRAGIAWPPPVAHCTLFLNSSRSREEVGNAGAGFGNKKKSKRTVSMH